MMLDPVLLSRLQFAFTVSFHIVFPTMSIGLAAFLVLVEYLYLKTGDELYERIYTVIPPSPYRHCTRTDSLIPGQNVI